MYKIPQASPMESPDIELSMNEVIKRMFVGIKITASTEGMVRNYIDRYIYYLAASGLLDKTEIFYNVHIAGNSIFIYPSNVYTRERFAALGDIKLSHKTIMGY